MSVAQIREERRELLKVVIIAIVVGGLMVNLVAQYVYYLFSAGLWGEAISTILVLAFLAYILSGIMIIRRRKIRDAFLFYIALNEKEGEVYPLYQNSRRSFFTMALLNEATRELSKLPKAFSERKTHLHILEYAILMWFRMEYAGSWLFERLEGKFFSTCRPYKKGLPSKEITIRDLPSQLLEENILFSDEIRHRLEILKHFSFHIPKDTTIRMNRIEDDESELTFINKYSRITVRLRFQGGSPIPRGTLLDFMDEKKLEGFSTHIYEIRFEGELTNWWKLLSIFPVFQVENYYLWMQRVHEGIRRDFCIP